MTEPDEQTEKGNEDDSENSESEEDEVIPDIGAFFIHFSDLVIHDLHEYRRYPPYNVCECFPNL